MKSTFIIVIAFLMMHSVCAQNAEARLDSLFHDPISKGEIHGCLAYIFQDGKVVLNKPYGMMDVENRKPIEKDAIFRLASMTKILTATAALKLYEEGKFLLDEPVKKYIPEFSQLKVLSPECKNIDTIVTVALQREVTIRDLFRHTAGFGYGGTDIVGQLYTKNIGFIESLTLEQFVKRILTVPLKFQPGSKWEYSYANDILGYLVEVISKKPLDEYMNEVIFKPLGMINSGFWVSSENLPRLCNHYSFSNGSLKLIDGSKNSKLAKRPAFISGGGGGVSTANDYSKFCQMLLNYGEYNGTRILSRQTVELLISDQISNIKDRGFPVNGFGFGSGVNSVVNGGGTTSVYWAGAPYNNTYIVDFKRHLIAIMFVQNSPWGHLGLMAKFEKIIHDEIL